MENKRKLYAAIVAAVTILGFSAFKITESKEGKILAPVTIYFHGSPANSADVENESLWTEEPNNENCDTGNQNACAMVVDESALATGTPGTRELDPSKLSIQALSTSSSSFIPDPDQSSGQPFEPLNRD